MDPAEKRCKHDLPRCTNMVAPQGISWFKTSINSSYDYPTLNPHSWSYVHQFSYSLWALSLQPLRIPGTPAGTQHQSGLGGLEAKKTLGLNLGLLQIARLHYHKLVGDFELITGSNVRTKTKSDFLGPVTLQ